MYLPYFSLLVKLLHLSQMQFDETTDVHVVRYNTVPLRVTDKTGDIQCYSGVR